MPEGLRDVPMRSIHVVEPHSPVTPARDGRYQEGSITARVETSMVKGVAQQLLHVIGTADTTVEELNQWFDALVAGQKDSMRVNAS